MSALAKVETAEITALPGQFERELAMIQSIREGIETAEPAQLAEWVAVLDAGAAVARLREADDVLREATRARVYALRRIGELALADPTVYEIPGMPSRNDGHGRHSGPHIEMIAQMPRELLDDTVEGLVSAGSECKLTYLVEGSRLRSLQHVEGNGLDGSIYRAWDGTLYVYAAGSRKRMKDDLEAARAFLRSKMNFGARASETDATAIASVEFLYERSRKGEQQLAALRDELSGVARTHLDDAVRFQQRVCEVLWLAYLETTA